MSVNYSYNGYSSQTRFPRCRFRHRKYPDRPKFARVFAPLQGFCRPMEQGQAERRHLFLFRQPESQRPSTVPAEGQGIEYPDQFLSAAGRRGQPAHRRRRTDEAIAGLSQPAGRICGTPQSRHYLRSPASGYARVQAIERKEKAGENCSIKCSSVKIYASSYISDGPDTQGRLKHLTINRIQP